MCVYPDEVVSKHFGAPKVSSTGARHGRTGPGEELPQLGAPPPAVFASLPGCGQGQDNMLRCQTLRSPLIPKWVSTRLQEAST